MCYMTRKIVPEMTYYVSSWMLNPIRNQNVEDIKSPMRAAVYQNTAILEPIRALNNLLLP